MEWSKGVWLLLIIVAVFGFVVGNILLLRDHKSFKIPKDFKKRQYDDDDNDDKGFY